MGLNLGVKPYSLCGDAFIVSHDLTERVRYEITVYKLDGYR
jgi:hypothetical protein